MEDNVKFYQASNEVLKGKLAKTMVESKYCISRSLSTVRVYKLLSYERRGYQQKMQWFGYFFKIRMRQGGDLLGV